MVALQPIKVYFLGNLDLCRVFYIFETTIQKNAIGVAFIYELCDILRNRNTERMKIKQALIILETQKQKVLNPKYPNNEEWICETSSFIKDFFGPESDEYSRINKFKWSISILNITPQNEIDFLHRKKEQDIVMFLDNCKNTLSIKGMYKPNKKNILSDKSNWELLTILSGIFIFSCGVSYWTLETDFFAVLLKNKKSSFFSTSSTSSKKITNLEKENGKP